MKKNAQMEFSIFNLQIASASAAQVIADHQASRDEIMPPVSAAPTKNSRVQALQRLAIQKGRSFSRLFFKIFDHTEKWTKICVSNLSYAEF